MRLRTQDMMVLHAGGLREGMLRPLEEECPVTSMASRPGTGMPAVPRSPVEQISIAGHSISSEMGQTEWRISSYETNPPSSEEETGQSVIRCITGCHACTTPSSACQFPGCWSSAEAMALRWVVQCMPAELSVMDRTVCLT